MTFEKITAGKYIRQNDTDDEKKGNFCSPGRVSVTEGTTPQTRSKAVEAPQLGNMHRSSVDRLVAPPEGHQFTSIHRPDQPPASHVDLPGLRAHQEAMLRPRQKRKHKRGE